MSQRGDVDGCANMPLRLPIELCEAVIHSLDVYNDIATLCACSLTCKALLPASQCLLFYYAQLWDEQTTELFAETICPTNPSTSLATHVRHLSIDTSRGGCPYNALPLLAERLVDVTVLELTFLDWGSLGDAAQDMVTSNFQKVKRLSLDSCSFETSGQLNYVISSFLSLTNLSFFTSLWGRDVGLVRTPLPHGLTDITLHTRQSFFCDRLLRMESHPCVHTIQLWSMGLRHTQGVNILLKTLGRSLRHLTIRELGVESLETES